MEWGSFVRPMTLARAPLAQLRGITIFFLALNKTAAETAATHRIFQDRFILPRVHTRDGKKNLKKLQPSLLQMTDVQEGKFNIQLHIYLQPIRRPIPLRVEGRACIFYCSFLTWKASVEDLYTPRTNGAFQKTTNPMT